MKFQISAKSQNGKMSLSKTKFLQLVSDKLSEFEGFDFDISPLSGETSATEKQSKLAQVESSIESYAEKIERLSSTLNLIARDSQQPHPYGQTVKKLKSDPDQDASELKKLEKISANAPAISRVRKFLVELPTGEEFDELRLQQRIINLSINENSLYLEPEKISGLVLQEFEKYRAAYTKKYLARIEKIQAQLKSWGKKRKTLEQKIFTISQLDKIPALQTDIEPEKLQNQLEQIFTKNNLPEIEQEDLQKILRVEPVFAGVTFFTPLPGNEFEKLAEDVDHTLEKQLAKISATSTKKIITSSRDPALKKLGRVITLSGLDKSTKIFTPETAPHLVSELQKVFDGTSSTFLNLGDFKPKTKRLIRAKDATLIAVELEEFLRRKMLNASKKITLLS